MCYDKKMQILNRSSSNNELKDYQTEVNQSGEKNQAIHKETLFLRKYENWKALNLLAIFSLMLSNFTFLSLKFSCLEAGFFPTS